MHDDIPRHLTGPRRPTTASLTPAWAHSAVMLGLSEKRDPSSSCNVLVITALRQQERCQCGHEAAQRCQSQVWTCQSDAKRPNESPKRGRPSDRKQSSQARREHGANGDLSRQKAAVRDEWSGRQGNHLVVLMRICLGLHGEKLINTDFIRQHSHNVLYCCSVRNRGNTQSNYIFAAV